MLPFAAAIEDKFLCINGGVGNIDSLIDIKNIERPARVRESQTIVDLLWSELGGDQNLGYKSHRASETEVEQFLEENGLDMIINTKDGLEDGVEESKCALSIFSVPNYGGRSNKGGILRINKNLQVIPHILKGSPSRKNEWLSENLKTNLTLNEGESELRRTMFQLV